MEARLYGGPFLYHNLVMDVTATFQGITTPIKDLFSEIHARGWEVTNVDTKDGVYVATVRNPHGDSVEKTGRDEPTALANCLTYIVRKEFIRQGAWTTHWGDQLESIAQAYAKAPAYDPAAVGAWHELANDCASRADALKQQLRVEYTHDPTPYSSPQDLWKDVEHKKRIQVSTAGSDNHPVWSPDQVLNYRLVHDVLGHAAAGGDFGWTGENLATAAHMPYLSPSAQAALFTEAIGNSAHKTYHRGWGPPKIVFLNEYLQPTQAEQNSPGHGGEPIGATLSPGPLPVRKEAGSPFEAPEACPYCKGTSFGYIRSKRRDEAGKWLWQCKTCGINGRRAIDVGVPGYNSPVLSPRQAGVRRDPNYDYQTGIVPPAINAVTAFGDPLGSVELRDVAHKLDTGWANFVTPEGTPDLSRIKVTISNALRAAILSPRKELRWNAVHYQDLSHIPADTSDPKVYWDALENARIEHNRAAGVPNPEIAHKAHYEALLDFYRYYAKHHPDMNPSEVKDNADREVQVMQAEIEEKVWHESKEPELDVFEPKVYKMLDRRLKQIVKDEKPLLYTAAAQDIFGRPDRYGAFIGRQCIAIAKVARYLDYLAEAALEDMKNHDGSGHIFRHALLSLQIPYIGAKVASFTWLLLAPLTSQLATIDGHIMDVLGHDRKKMTNRDYFRMERELQAGRDASGYGHLPLGQYQWGMWDGKRTGWGTHQDHSPLRPWEPVPHHGIDWPPSVGLQSGRGQKEEFIPPEWWAMTEPYRQNEIAKWNTDVAPYYTQKKIPWANLDAEVPDTGV